jgi:hypothetical protein
MKGSIVVKQNPSVGRRALDVCWKNMRIRNRPFDVFGVCRGRMTRHRALGPIFIVFEPDTEPGKDTNFSIRIPKREFLVARCFEQHTGFRDTLCNSLVKRCAMLRWVLRQVGSLEQSGLLFNLLPIPQKRWIIINVIRIRPVSGKTFSLTFAHEDSRRGCFYA